MKFTCSIQLQNPFKFCLLGFQTFGGAPNFTGPGYRCAVNLKHLLEKDNSSNVDSPHNLAFQTFVYVQYLLDWVALQGTKFKNLWSEEVRGVFYSVCTINRESHTFPQKTVGEFCGSASGWREIGQCKLHLVMYVQPYWLLAWSWWLTIQSCSRHIPQVIIWTTINHHEQSLTIMPNYWLIPPGGQPASWLWKVRCKLQRSSNTDLKELGFCGTVISAM